MKKEFHSKVPKYVLPQVIHFFGEFQEILDRCSKSVNWDDFTAIYPDRFDGDNILQGHWHSRKMTVNPAKPNTLKWKDGSVCSAISGMIWQTRGYYREYKAEEDVFVGEQHKLTVVGNLIKLTHYIVDGNGTLVHLIPGDETASLDKENKSFHEIFEEDMKNAVDALLPQTQPVQIKEKPITNRDPYMESLKRAEKHYWDYKEMILGLYQNGKSLSDIQDDNVKTIALKIVQENCQNIADYWIHIAQSLKFDQEKEADSKRRGLSLPD